MEFLAGLVLGSILGVVADRIWSWIEQRPRFEISGAYFVNYKREEGYSFRVRNVGGHDIPPYRLVLFHPLRGTLSFLNAADQDTPLLPGQTREHSAPFVKEGKPSDFLQRWLTHERDVEIPQPATEGFVLRIVLHKSDRVLFESKRIGQTYATLALRAFELGHAGSSTWEEDIAMRTPPPLVEQWRNAIRRRLFRRSVAIPAPVEIEGTRANGEHGS